MELIYLLIGVILAVVILALLWQALTLALTLFPGLSAEVRTILAILGLLLLVVILVWFFGDLVPLPR